LSREQEKRLSVTIASGRIADPGTKAFYILRSLILAEEVGMRIVIRACRAGPTRTTRFDSIKFTEI